MNIKELRKKKLEDLNKLLKTSREELRSLRFSISSEQEKNVRKIRDIKKTIAKILTILNTKKTVEVKGKVEKDLSSEIPVKEEEIKKEDKKDQVKLEK